MKNKFQNSHLRCFTGFTQQIYYLVSLTDVIVSSLPMGACEVTCLLKTRAGNHSVLRNKHLLCLYCIVLHCVASMVPNKRLQIHFFSQA